LKKPHALIGLLAAVGTAIGVLVAVFGLPYGRMNYTAFAGLYHNPAGSGTPAPAGHYALDCDATTAVIDEVCNYADTVTSITVAQVFSDNSGPYSIGALAFTVLNPNSTLINAPAVVDGTGHNSNPDFQDANLNDPGTAQFNCSLIPPDNDDGSGGPGTQASTLDCFLNTGTAPSYAQGANTAVAVITYNHTSGVDGSAVLTFTRGVIGDSGGAELLNCNGPDGLPGGGDDPGQCFPATVNFVPGPTATPTNTPLPTNTPTNTPTATNTPAGGTMSKHPEGNANNVDPAIPAANLWICVTGPCSGPGEGDLIVFEYATNVQTGDFDGNTVADGLGAYEFQVEYDNFVIQSVNPSDVVFEPLGSISPYPGGYDGVLDGEGFARAPANCSFSIVTENTVRFGCVTSGSAAGPQGDMDIARLDLIPHPDLTNDIFPGNNNGVVTVIKDNGCELVDTFGHPTQGSVNGGLTPVCGDLAVTVRILEGDLNLDCKVDVQDQQLIAFRYGSFFGSLLYSKWYDLEPALHDLDIDIKDLQKVFGRDGSTCQNPIQPQPPLPPPAPFGN
jgi:hypothetical protein